METKLQEPINACLLEEDDNGAIDMSYEQFLIRNYRFENHPYHSLPSLEDTKVPFLQMLQGVDEQQTASFNNFQSISTTEFESCVTNNNNDMVMEFQQEFQIPSLPLKNYNNDLQNQRVKGKSKRSQLHKLLEKRKRKRSTKNKEEVESQRLTHIAVERNRRRQMNEHLNALRSLMPPSYIHRGDQASIIGGAIDYVKQLEQLIQSLEAHKRMRQLQSQENGDVSTYEDQSFSFKFRNNPIFNEEGKSNNYEDLSAEIRSDVGDIQVIVIQNHVNLKIQCNKRPAGQLFKAIVGLGDLRLSVLHLNITSLHSQVHYSFNLKIEEGCKLGTAKEVARAVHQIFSLINIS